MYSKDGDSLVGIFIFEENACTCLSFTLKKGHYRQAQMLFEVGGLRNCSEIIQFRSNRLVYQVTLKAF